MTAHLSEVGGSDHPEIIPDDDTEGEATGGFAQESPQGGRGEHGASCVGGVPHMLILGHERGVPAVFAHNSTSLESPLGCTVGFTHQNLMTSLGISGLEPAIFPAPCPLVFWYGLFLGLARDNIGAGR